MFFLLHGKDTCRSRRYLAKLKDKFRRERDPQGLNLVVLDAEKSADAARMLSELSSSPFLADKRMVVIEGLCARGTTEVQQQVLEYLEARGDQETAITIFWEDAATPSTSSKKQKKQSIAGTQLLDLLKKQPYSQLFDALSPKERHAWIVGEVKDLGGSGIDLAAAETLAEHCGDDTWRMHHVLNQALSFGKEGRSTSSADLAPFLDAHADENIFSLTDAIVSKNARSSYTLLDEQYRQGTEANQIFFLLTGQFWTLLLMRDLLDREHISSSKDIASRLKIHPFVAQKSLGSVERERRERLQTIYGELCRMEQATKTGGQALEVLLDVFIGKRGILNEGLGTSD